MDECIKDWPTPCPLGCYVSDVRSGSGFKCDSGNLTGIYYGVGDPFVENYCQSAFPGSQPMAHQDVVASCINRGGIWDNNIGTYNTADNGSFLVEGCCNY